MMTNKIRINKLIPIIVFLVAGLLGASCSSRRSTAGSATTTGNIEPLPSPESPVTALSMTYAALPSWDTFYAPFSVKLSQPMNLSVSGRATMVRNESIHLSLRVLGMEVAVVHIDADSVWLVDKFHRVTCVEPMSRLTGKAGLSVGNLQDMMLGRAFYPGRPGLTAQDDKLFSKTRQPDGWCLTPAAGVSAYDCWQMLTSDTPELTSILIMPGGNNRVEINYSGTTSAACGPLPKTIAGAGVIGKFRLSCSLTWDTGKIKINDTKVEKWTPPASYRRVTAHQAVEMIKSM